MSKVSRLPIWFLACFDVFSLVIAGVVALMMRLDGQLPVEYVQSWLLAATCCLPIAYFIFRWHGMYTRIWRYASAGDLIQIAKASAFLAASMAGAIYLLGLNFPRGALIMAWLIMLALLGGIRYSIKIVNERELGLSHITNASGDPTLVLGAGSAGQQLVREIIRHPELGYRVIGFLDDDPSKLDMTIHGHKVIGTIDDLELLAANYGIKRVVLALPSAAGVRIRNVSLRAQNLGLNVQTVPSLSEVVGGKVSVTRIRPVQLDDLLRRPPVTLDSSAIENMVKGKVVLITGAGGSIGSEISRQVWQLEPKQILLLGRGENSIYQIWEELKSRDANRAQGVIPIICDIRNRANMERVFMKYHPDLVFHAAAHKHVPLMEYFPAEAIDNNVFGTKNVAELALAYKAERFVMISTDKAVNAANAMGASKRAAELVVDSLRDKGNTRFMIVRFGNVLGSRGSAPLRFQQQIAEGGPVTLTDERMVRYFMTIPEAVQLVLQAGSMGSGGELFILDMGEPVKMIDMIHDLIRLSGLEPDKDIKIVITGSRPGETLYEELMTPEEGVEASTHEKITIAKRSHITEAQLTQLLDNLRSLLHESEIEPLQLLTAVAEAQGKQVYRRD